MKITLLWVGKTRNSRIRELVEDYAGRIRHFTPLTVVEVKPAEGGRPKPIVLDESERLLARVLPEDYVVVLNPQGQQMSTEEFTGLIARLRDGSLKHLIFLVGGHYGLSPAVSSRANQLLSLTRMTMNHEMARLLLAEQIYRAFTLIHHLPYHK